MVVLHIGLPKTGTTFLQHAIFRRTPQVRFLHRGRRGDGARICGDLRSLARAEESKAERLSKGLAERLRRLHAEAPEPLLVSDEKISVDAAAF